MARVLGHGLKVEPKKSETVHQSRPKEALPFINQLKGAAESGRDKKSAACFFGIYQPRIAP
jgi:hypothetical protein